MLLWVLCCCLPALGFGALSYFQINPKFALLLVSLGSAVNLLLILEFLDRKNLEIRGKKGLPQVSDQSLEGFPDPDIQILADSVSHMTNQLRDQIAREAESRQFDSFIRLSASLTHDLKNAIEALSLTVSNMERHFENAEFRADAMQTLRGATENLRAIVTRLSQPITTLSGEHKRPRAVDLVPMLRRVISMTAAQASTHRTVVRLPESLFALVDIDRMQKVVENLIINALEAMAGRSGQLTIEAGVSNGRKVFFSVTDTGDGMTERFIEERLFHPFATTKKRGVGLGLYTCREVVRANGGNIEVSSEQGAGTTFRVVLPSAPLENIR